MNVFAELADNRLYGCRKYGTTGTVIVKTDHRDTKKLLGLFMADMLTEVYPPNEEQEAARELTRCREAAQGISKEFAINYRNCLSAMDMFSLAVSTGQKSITGG